MKRLSSAPHVAAAISFAAVCTASVAAPALPVIPGAAGFGVDTPAGRFGRIYRITNLNQGGSGSLRECIEDRGARVCVFEVSGTINLTRNLMVRNPYLTIA